MSNVAAPTAYTGHPRVGWQEKLQGGRTAWGCQITIIATDFYSRFFYDSDHNAREDVAEVAFKHIVSGQPLTPTPKPQPAGNQAYTQYRP
ncbi:hypothetical protein FQN53_008088 [Emmonsiellopsis sp. PD_33]|nr:hypothetical protein FQN53_008088 [Emmonsiellopsis sp. PD_33]